MGQRATELLLNRLSDSKTESYQEIVLPTELIVRRSSGDEINESMNMGREQIFAINPMDKLATSWGRIKKVSSQGESNE